MTSRRESSRRLGNHRAWRFAVKMPIRLLSLWLAGVGGGSVGGATVDDGGTAPIGYRPDRWKVATGLARKLLVLDSHIDVPFRLTKSPEDISVETRRGEFDFVRATRGGLKAAFMSIYVPTTFQDKPGAAKAYALSLITMMDEIIRAHPTKFSHAYHPDDLIRNRDKGLISLPYGLENGAAIEGDLYNLQELFVRGIRYITLTHGKRNQLADSSYDRDRTWNGLSPFGRLAVREMNRLGILVDVSHVSDKAFDDILLTSATPVVATHSSCRHFTPGFERNMSDRMIKALAQAGGVIQINFGSIFLTERANQHQRRRDETIAGAKRQIGVSDGADSRLADSVATYDRDHPFPYGTVDDVVHHILHVVQLVGIEHVGLGSDFDGVYGQLPVGLQSVADYPILIYRLLEQGWTENDLEKLLSANFLRVWRQANQYALQQAELR